MPKAEITRIALPGGKRCAPRFLLLDGTESRQLIDRCTHRPEVVLGLARDLDAALIAQVTPCAVVFSLFAARHDAHAILDRLSAANFRGRVFALSPPLPDRAMVERELRARCPRLRLRILPILT